MPEGHTGWNISEERKGLLGDGEEAAWGRSCHSLLVLAQSCLHRHPCPPPFQGQLMETW